MRSPEFKLVALEPAPRPTPKPAPACSYDAATKRVFLDVQELLTLPAGKQYQLWASIKASPLMRACWPPTPPPAKAC
ncbi:MAG: hypothetical protein WKG07_05755, partial [Hymenobacter sp.]